MKMKLLLLMVVVTTSGALESRAASLNETRFAPLDVRALYLEELKNSRKGEAPRYAVPEEVRIAPESLSDYEPTSEGMRVWRHRVISPNAVSLNFGFTQFKLPDGAELNIRATDGSTWIRSFTSEDNSPQGELWTPVILSDDVTLELRVPEDRVDELRFQLGQVGRGFRTFSETAQSGSCNVDVACSNSKGWEKEVSAVAVISTGGSTFCTGFMVNNTAKNRSPLFMTARHCGITSWNAASLVVYWNYQASQCGGARDGKLTDFQSGAAHLASSSRSDFTLVKLNSLPKPEWGVRYAGWSRADQNAPSAVAIHHPITHEKAISFENDPTQITGYLGREPGGDRTHLRVVDWDVGTTEPGSSGSPLFDSNRRVIGQLHGGWAACENDDSDYYGRIAVSWEGDGTSQSRLRDHLDPANSGAVTVDAL